MRRNIREPFGKEGVHLNTKVKIGISFVVVAIVLLAVAIIMTQTNLAASGPWAGKITTYKPPFEYHGFLTILIGVGAAVFFLPGAVLTVLGKNEQ